MEVAPSSGRRGAPALAGASKSLSARLGVGALAAAIALLALPNLALAQTFTVTNMSNSGVSGDGSLRGEVIAANANSGADTIVFASGLSGTITFAGSGIVITDPVDIEGPGPGQITVTQTSAHRVFDVELTSAGGSVTIAGLHIAGGTAPNSGPNEGLGGDILSVNADLSVLNALVTGGNAEEGGGIESLQDPLTLRSSTVSGNDAEAYAGVVAGGVADFTIQSSTISGNTASGPDGGLYAQTEHSGLIEGSTIAGNTAKAEAGVNFNAVGAGQITVRNSTIANNTASEEAGGVEVSIVPGAAVTIEHSTIAANHANGGPGGGIRFVSGSGLKIKNTIVAGNTASGAGPDIDSLTGKVVTAFSLVGNTSSAKLTESVAGSDLLGVDPQLGPLADNGGPTQTMALGTSSPAVNKGSSTLGTDQRGLQRPVLYPGIANATAPGANGADIGAFELQVPSPPVAIGPSNRFRFGKVKLNKRRGTATVSVKVPGAGIVRLLGSKTVRKTSKTAKGAATVKLLVKAKGKALRALDANGKVKLKARFTFTPTGGTPATKIKNLRLIKSG